MSDMSQKTANTSWHESSYAPLIVWIGTFFALLILMDVAVNVYDEGIVLTAARQVMSGEVLHRDFYSEYGPGSYIIISTLFSLFSPSFLVARLFGIGAEATIATLVFALLRNRARKLLTFGATIVCFAWLVASKNYLYPIFPCIALTLVSAMTLLRPNAVQSSFALLGAGCCCGLTAYFRYDTGFFAFAADALAIALTLMSRYSGKKGILLGLRSMTILGVGAAITFAPGAIAYLLTSPLTAFRADVVDYPVKYYARMRSLPFPGFLDLVKNPTEIGVYLPFCAVAAAFPMTLREWAASDTREVNERSVYLQPLLLFSLLSLIFCYKGLVRVSTVHMLLAIIPALVLLALVIDRWWDKVRGLRVMAITLALIATLSTALAALPQILGFQQAPRRFVAGLIAEHMGILPYAQDASEMCRAWTGMRFAWLNRPYALAAYYIATHSKQDDRILVGLDRHDKIFINAQVLYFAANRLPGTRWAQYDPGLQTREDIQREMIDELVRNHVLYIVRDASFDARNEPNESAKSSGVFLLDGYIDKHYRPVGRSGKVQVWLRDDAIPTSVDPGLGACQLDPPSPQTNL